MTTAIQEYNEIDAGLAVLREAYAGSVWVVDTTARLHAAKKARADLRDRRVELEAIRKRIKEPALTRCKEIDSEAKRITAELLAIEEPIDASIKAEEARKEAEREAKRKVEEERIAKARAEVDAIRAPARTLIGRPSSEIDAAGRALHALDVSRSDEFSDEARVAKEETLQALRNMLAASRVAETEAKRLADERAELARLRAEQEAREAEARAQRAAEEKSAQEKIAQAERESRERIEVLGREVREAREEEEARKRAERQRIDAAAEAVHRAQLEQMEARELLKAFAQRFGARPEFARIAAEIGAYFAAHKDAEKGAAA